MITVRIQQKQVYKCHKMLFKEIDKCVILQQDVSNYDKIWKMRGI